MEATSVRMADGNTHRSSWQPPNSTPLHRYIRNACDPQNYEPNLALDLEIADLINAKKGSAPRDAAIEIVNQINSRNPNISLLGTTLLDICVKNCGYPFQLQIATKEFLNELVRRFPEHPPMRYSKVQNRILELIGEWRQTICLTSKYKEDLGYIRDMHRLLAYKGYAFPEVKQEQLSVLNPSDALRSAEEMEAEENAAMSAKLQELIRRGTPHDLQEANKMMKVMAGYDTRNKTNYRAKAAAEVSKVQAKARLLEDMLQNYKPGDESIKSDAWEELGNALASAHPKIQKMCEEESDDHEAVAKLLEINDSIHRTLNRYRLTKKGEYEAAQQIPKGTLGTSGAGVATGPGNELSLIDLGGADDVMQPAAAPAQSDPLGDFNAPGPSQSAAPAAAQSGGLEDDLLGLSLDAQPAIRLGGEPTAPSLFPPGMSGFSSHSQTPVPAPSAQATKPNYNALASLGMGGQTQARPGSSGTPARTSIGGAPSAQRAHDPFAALSGLSNPGSRTGSPMPFQQAPHPPMSSGLAGLGSMAPAAASPAQSSLLGGGDDDWAFSSSVGGHELTVVNSSIKVVFSVTRPGQPADMLMINSSVSNNTPQAISDFTFQLAVTKGFTLKLEPQSGRGLAPSQAGGITQNIQLHGVEQGRGTSVKCRWKASYLLGGVRREEQGELASLGVA